MTRSKKIRNIISSIKKKRPTKEEIRSFASTLIELMAESGIPTKTRRELYQYSQELSYRPERLIGFAEDTLLTIEK